jgi:hypothetical protein
MLLCGSNSIPRKVKHCERTQSALLVSKRFKRYGRILTISTLVWICRNNTGLSGGVSGRLYSVIFEIREDSDGEYCHLITLWKATKEERKLYEENFQS